MAPNVTYEYKMGKRTNIKKSRKWAATPVYKMQIATYGVKRASAWLPGMSFVKSKDTFDILCGYRNLIL